MRGSIHRSIGSLPKVAQSKVMTIKSLWKCPTCGREFAKRNQLHSCASLSVDDHFRGKPALLRQTFDELLANIRGFGPIRIDAVKSAINLAGEYHFAMVYVRERCLNVEFALDRPLEHERISRTQRLGETRYIHVVRLEHSGDADAQLVGWLSEAYSLSG